VITRLPEIRLHRRRAGQARGHPEIHRPPPARRLRNSDGDLQMLQWTAAGAGPRFVLIVHHTDAEREWAYDRKSPIGKLDKALDEAKAPRLDSGEHEGRLEDDLSAGEVGVDPGRYWTKVQLPAAPAWIKKGNDSLPELLSSTEILGPVASPRLARSCRGGAAERNEDLRA